MPPAKSPALASLALPDWLTSRVSRAALCLCSVAALMRALVFAGVIPHQVGDTAMAAVVAVACLMAWRETHPLLHERSARFDMRSTWRLQRHATLVFTACALSAAAAGFVSGPMRTALLLTGSLGSIVGLCITMLATVRIPGGEIARCHRITAGLDIATLMLAGLVGFWVFALHPALLVASAGGPAWPILVIASYAFISLLLVSMLMLMPFRLREGSVNRGLGLVALGSMAVVGTEVVPLCNGLVADGFAARPAFLGWTIFALALAIHADASRDQRPPRTAQDTHHIRFAMPFASIGLVAVLLFAWLVSPSIWRENTPLFLPAMVLAFLLVVVRQTVIARENLAMALEMQRAKEVAESANSARLQFLANISHDLRTPLNGVLGCAQILLREKSFTSKNRELLKTIQGCAEHLRNLISDLLDLSKLEADRLELAPSPFDLKSLLKALIKTFELEAENKQIVLELDEVAGLPTWVQCDRKRLQQILGNLVHNAIKFTDHGRVKVRAQVESGAMIFNVIDTGCGILPHKLGDLFQPFHVVDERSIKLEGTGLGLSICKKLARKMGGDIAVHSTIGKGSTFTVTIPLIESEAVVEVQRTVVDYQGRRRRILIVDDNAANRVVLRTMLEPLDFLIHEAGDAQAAHEQIGLAKPDIILMDLMMPGTDGFILCREVIDLEILPPPAMIAVSAMAGEDVLKRCAEAGFADLLNKPVHLDQLVECLHTHAGVEWTYGVLQPAPSTPDETTRGETILPPPPEEVSAFLDLARRGVVRNIESRAEQLAHLHPEYTNFARRVARYASDFKLKELGEWLTSLSTPQPHGSA